MLHGRNEPCPCGSGRKYKKCCFADQHAMPLEVARANSVKAADRDLMHRILKGAKKRSGDDWFDSAAVAYTGNADEKVDENELQLLIPWAVYHWPLAHSGRAVAQEFRNEDVRRLPREHLDLLDVQLEGWLSIWEVREVVPGVGMSLADLLTGEERFVHEVIGSATVNPRDAVLAIITTVGEISFGSATHPQPLGPRDSACIVREMRRICRVRTKPVRIERLRDVSIQLALIHLWNDTVARALVRPLPTITNTDGDEMVPTTDHFDILDSDHSGLLSRLAKLPGAGGPEQGESKKRETVIVMTKPGNASLKSWDNTIIGRLVMKGNRLEVESNSARRADSLRDLLTREVGDLLRYRLRSDAGQAELHRIAAKPSTRIKRTRTDMPPGLTALMKEFRENHMRAWLDEDIPALGGLTPRAAATSPRSREALEQLLREFENHEAGLSEGERIDIDHLRDELDMSG